MAILGVVPNGADHTLNSGLRTCVNIGGGRRKHRNSNIFRDSEDSPTINTLTACYQQDLLSALTIEACYASKPVNPSLPAVSGARPAVRPRPR